MNYIKPINNYKCIIKIIIKYFNCNICTHVNIYIYGDHIKGIAEVLLIAYGDRRQHLYYFKIILMKMYYYWYEKY